MSSVDLKQQLLSKHSLRILLGVCLLIVLSVLYFWLTNPKAFPIEHVVVKGSYPHVQNQQLQQMITPYARQGLFGLSASRLQKNLEQIPWIAEANIRRQFPATIVVTLTEEQPVYIWNNKSLMTHDGKLFTPERDSFPKHLPSLSGPEQEYQLLFSTMQSINQLLQPLQLTLTNLKLSERGSWTMVMSNGIEVMIGKHDLWARLQQFVKVYPQALAAKQKKIVSIDLRYPNGFAVMWKR